jgi:hypothetical protein
MKKPRNLRMSLLLAFVLAGSAAARAQVTTGDILGTVTDQNDSAVVHAAVVVENAGTHEQRTAQTGSNGDYDVTLLNPGMYSVKVTGTGFKTFTTSLFQLVAGDRVRVNASLSVGRVSETVTVQTQASALQTDSSVLSDNIGEQQTQELPLNGRNFIQLVQLTPGVNEGDQGGLVGGAELDDHRQSAEMSVNGQSDVLNNQMIDGADNNERLIGTVGVRPSVEAINEVQVQTNDYSADVSRTGGGVVNIITKSGTDTFHGSLFEYFRNDILDANTYNFGVNLPKAELRQNQFGGSLSGPIHHDKTFFFGDYEGYRVVNATAPTVSIVPTAFELANPGNFSDMPCSASTPQNCANFAPDYPTGTYDKAGLAYFELQPKPNEGTNEYVGSSKNTQNSDDFDVRLDQHFNANNSLFGRFIYNRVFSTSPAGGPVGGWPDAPLVGTSLTVAPSAPDADSYNSLDFDYNAMLNYIHIFTPRLVLELKASYTFDHNDSYGMNTGLNPNTALGQANVDTPLDNGTALQTIEIADTGVSMGDLWAEPLVDHDNTFQYQGSVTYTKGPHNFKLGASLIRRQLTSVQSSVAAGYPLFYSFVDLLQGEYPEDVIPREQELDAPHLRMWEIGEYGEDDWHVTKWLTLNLGLRYDIYTPYTEILDRISTWDPVTESLLIAGQNGVSSSAGVETDYRGVEPRFGFAATVAKDLVVRGGFGMSYVPSNNTSVANMKNTPFVSSINCGYTTCGPFADGEPPIETVQENEATGPLNFPGVTLDGMDPKFKSTYFMQYNLTVQKEYRGNVATVSYVGLLSRDGPESFDDINNPGANTCLNSANPTACENALRPYYAKYPDLSTVSEYETHGESSYNALEASYERRFIHGLGVNMNYTFAHNLGDIGGIPGSGGGGWGEQPALTRQVDYGNNAMDIRNRIAATGEYQLPFGQRSHGLEAAAIKGWEYNIILSWSTGLPYDIVNNGSVSNSIPGDNDRPNVIGNANISHPSVSEYFNPAAFAEQTAGTFGNEAINPYHGPHWRHADMSLNKTFPLYERYNLQFRAEAFNISNTTNFAAPNTTLNAADFGQITSTNPGYTPREYQFALKLVF